LSAQFEKQVSEMSDLTSNSDESSDKYFLEDQERWEKLGFDWESWNRTVVKILQQQSATSSNGPE
jgi:hypothetical protein